jgi:short-subunit dehydrogenase
MDAKRILITGGCSVLGRALTALYLSRGHIVTIADIIPPIDPLNDRCHYVPFDCERPTFEWLADHRRFDVVICNAGISDSTDFLKTNHHLDIKMMQINALGHIDLVRALLNSNKIAAQGRLAVIISASQFLPFPIAISYAASKAALDGFAQAIAPYLRDRGISVTRIYPGPMTTPHAQKYYAQYQQGRGSTPEKVAVPIYQGIAARQRQVLPDRAAQFFWLASHLCPGWLEYFVWRKYYVQ